MLHIMTIIEQIQVRLNVLFKFKSNDRIVYCVVNISLIQCVVGGVDQVVEEMLPIRCSRREGYVVVLIVNIGGMVQLIPLNLRDT